MHSTPIYDSSVRGWRPWDELVRLVASTDLLVELIRRNVVMMYRRSVLGVLWSILHPLFLLAALTIVFSSIFRSLEERFALHVFSGLLVWTFVSQTTVWSMNDFVRGGLLLARVRIPPSAFACAAVGTGLVNLLLSIPVLLGIAIIEGAHVGPSWVMIPYAIACAAAFTLGLSLALSTVAAYFSDVVEMYRVVQFAWLFLTPVFYPLEALPESVRLWLWLNPLIPILDLLRIPIVADGWPPLTTVIVAGVTALVTLCGGWIIFSGRTDDLIARI